MLYVSLDWDRKNIIFLEKAWQNEASLPYVAWLHAFMMLTPEKSLWEEETFVSLPVTAY